MLWSANPIYIIDFEGTYRSGVLEYGVVTLYEGEIVDTQTRFCSTEKGILNDEYLQHGIKEEYLKNALPFEHEWDFFNTIRATGPLGAHHASVENKFLKIVWPYPSESKNFMSPGETIVDWGPWLDTYQLYKRIFPQLENYKLSFLIERFDLQENLNELARKHCPKKRSNYHCALYDAIASAVLLKHLSSIDGFTDVTLEWLLMHSISSSDKYLDTIQEDLF